MWYACRDYDKAIKDFSEAIRLDPNCAHSFFGRGVARLARGEADKAYKDIDEAIRLDPRFHKRAEEIGLTTSLGDFKDYFKATDDYPLLRRVKRNGSGPGDDR
jgi:tetratricopeptide (TPR) repeat protein